MKSEVKTWVSTQSPPTPNSFRLDELEGASYRVFFEVAPDGLCYMIAERQA